MSTPWIIRVPLLLSLSAALLAGCNQGPAGGNGERTNWIAEPDAGAALRCTAIRAQSASAEPFDLVALEQAGDVDIDTFYLRVDGLDGSESIAPLLQDEHGEFQFRAPFHPGGSVVGGSVLLTVTNGVDACPAIGFTVSPLPVPADADLLDELWDGIDARAAARYAAAGTDAASLRAAELAELPGEWIPLALLAELQANFDPAAELDALDADTRALVLAVIAKLGLLDQLPAATPSATATRALAEPRLAPHVLPRVNPRNTGSDNCTTVPISNPPEFELDTPQQLADLMREAIAERESLTERRRTNSAVGHALTPLSLASPDLRVKAAVGVIKASLYALSAFDAYDAYAKPDQLSRLSFNLSQTRIEEDWDRQLDGDITWNTARVWATSPGARLNGPQQGSDDNPAGFDSRLPPAPLSPAEQAVQDRLDAFDPGAGETNCFQLLPQEYGPVLIPDDSGAHWTTAEVVAGNAVVLEDLYAPGGRHRIEPTRIGDATIRVITSPDVFPGPRVFRSRSLSVLQKRVQWTLPEIFVEQPGSQQQATFSIANARHAELSDLVVEPGAHVGIDSIDGADGLYDVSFSTPSEASQYPTSITVRSTSRQLPPAQPAREATIIISSRAAVQIDGEPDLCVEDGETYEFTAQYSGPEENPSLRWTVVSGPGSIGSDASAPGGHLLGIYSSAQGASGAVTIRVTSTADARVRDEFTFRVGDCSQVQVFYQLEGRINSPEGSSTCGAISADAGYSERNDTVDQDGIDPQNLPGPGWGPGQSFTFNETLVDPGSVTRDVGGNCVTRSIPSASRNDASLSMAADGSTVNVDFDVNAEAACNTFPPATAGDDPDVVCASANSSSLFWARYDLDIDREQTWQVTVELACTDTSRLPEQVPVVPNVSVSVVRFTADGQLRLSHTDPMRAVLPINQRCDSTQAVSLARAVEFDAPTVAGTTDRAVIIVNGGIGVVPNPDQPIGQDAPRGTMVGTVHVAPTD